MSEELKPCPFCGSPRIDIVHIHGVRYGCECDHCGTMQDNDAATKKQAAYFWNNRNTRTTERNK